MSGGAGRHSIPNNGIGRYVGGPVEHENADHDAAREVRETGNTSTTHTYRSYIHGRIIYAIYSVDVWDVVAAYVSRMRASFLCLEFESSRELTSALQF